jgi:hypothetical protein
MRRPHRDTQGTSIVSARIEPEVKDALVDYTAQNGVSASNAINDLLKNALLSRGGQLGALASENLRDRGYNAGLRQGLHDAKTAITEAMSGLWRRG